MLKKPLHSGFSRWLPLPLTAILIVSGWLLIQHSVSLGNVILGVMLALLLTKLFERLLHRVPRFKIGRAMRLFVIVCWDIVISNIKVARWVLGPMSVLEPKWFYVPLASTHAHVNTLLAMIITATPGTLSVDVDEDAGTILVHCLHSDDVKSEIEGIKQRYEQPLLDIFLVSHANTEKVSTSGVAS